MKDLVDIFEENERNFYRKTINNRVKEEIRMKREEKKAEKRYHMDILDGALETETETGMFLHC